MSAIAKIGLAVLVIGRLMGSSAVGEVIHIEDVASISGENFKFIQTALPSFTAAKLKLDGYEIHVSTRNGVPWILFSPADRRKYRGYGSMPGKPSFEVILSKDGSAVEKAYWPR
jgi:hypothetical protein